MISIPCQRYKTNKTIFGRKRVKNLKIFYRNFNTSEEAANWIFKNDWHFNRQRRRVQAVIIPKEIENKIFALYFHTIR